MSNINKLVRLSLEGEDGNDEVELVCPNCGTEVEVPSQKALQVPVGEMKCPNCGTPLEPEKDEDFEGDEPEDE